MPPHSHGKLIVDAFFVGCVSLVTLLVTFPLSCIAAFVEKRRILGVLFMCMAFTPFPLASFTLHKVAEMRDITLDD